MESFFFQFTKISINIFCHFIWNWIMRIFVGMIRCLTPRLLSEFSICQGLTVQLFSLILIKLSTKPLLYFILLCYWGTIFSTSFGPSKTCYLLHVWKFLVSIFQLISNSSGLKRFWINSISQMRRLWPQGV